MSLTLRTSPPAPRAPLWAALAAALALGACSGTPAPREEMAVAKTTVDRVTTAPDTAAAAPVELQAARDKLSRAERAMAALKRYRYQPVVREGETVEQRARMRMRFTARDGR